MNEFIDKVSSEFQRRDYLVDMQPSIPGVQADLYVYSAKRIQMVFSKVEDHFVFIDCDKWGVNSPDQLTGIYRHFSDYVNLGFKTPHVWRISIPNLAIIAISQGEFSAEVVSLARITSFDPWYGGESGQVILVELGKRKVTSLASLSGGRYPRPGALPLGHAARVMREVCGQCGL